MRKLYLRTTPKYVIVYELLNKDKLKDFGKNTKYIPALIACSYINRITEKIAKMHMSTIWKKDIDKFLERNKPIKETKEGVDLIAKILLHHGNIF